MRFCFSCKLVLWCLSIPSVDEHWRLNIICLVWALLIYMDENKSLRESGGVATLSTTKNHLGKPVSKHWLAETIGLACWGLDLWVSNGGSPVHYQAGHMAFLVLVSKKSPRTPKVPQSSWCTQSSSCHWLTVAGKQVI